MYCALTQLHNLLRDASLCNVSKEPETRRLGQLVNQEIHQCLPFLGSQLTGTLALTGKLLYNEAERVHPDISSLHRFLVTLG
jgi:hypothetical protein